MALLWNVEKSYSTTTLIVASGFWFLTVHCKQIILRRDLQSCYACHTNNFGRALASLFLLTQGCSSQYARRCFKKNERSMVKTTRASKAWITRILIYTDFKPLRYHAVVISALQLCFLFKPCSSYCDLLLILTLNKVTPMQLY